MKLGEETREREVEGRETCRQTLRRGGDPNQRQPLSAGRRLLNVPPFAAGQRLRNITLIVIWLMLILAQMGRLPGLEYAWSLNLWQYLSPTVVAPLVIASLLVCVPTLRARFGVCVAQLAERSRISGGRFQAAVALVGVTVLFWLFREQTLFGDSEILIWSTSSRLFRFPDVGASFIMSRTLKLGVLLGLDAPSRVELMRAVSCLCGAGTLFFLARASRYVSPGARGTWFTFVMAGRLDTHLCQTRRGLRMPAHGSDSVTMAGDSIPGGTTDDSSGWPWCWAWRSGVMFRRCCCCRVCSRCALPGPTGPHSAPIWQRRPAC